MADTDIDKQVDRLEKQRTAYAKGKASPEIIVAVEQALASAYVARELNSIKQFLNGLTVVKEKV